MVNGPGFLPGAPFCCVSVLYIHLRYKINNMNKKEIRSAINKAAYQFAESLGYQMSDDNDGSTVTFMKPEAKTIDDSIEWSRSYHETCVLNWATDQTKTDAHLIDTHMKPIIEHFKSQYK